MGNIEFCLDILSLRFHRHLVETLSMKLKQTYGLVSVGDKNFEAVTKVSISVNTSPGRITLIHTFNLPLKVRIAVTFRLMIK